MEESLPLGRPALRQWELTEDSTRFDRNRAAPSDEELHRVWISWSTFYFMFSFFNFIVLLGVLSSKKVRRKPFNLYLIYLMIPDVLMTLPCAITCAYLAANGGFTHPWICRLQSIYIMFGVGANSWLNGVVVYELYQLLSQSKRRMRYTPPSLRRVTRNSLIVYLYSMIIACLGVAEWSFWPHQTENQNGLVCIPMAYDKKSTIFTWLVFTPLHNGIPVCFAIYVTVQVLRKNLLPPSGKRRELTIFFTRIVIVFVVMWLPGFFVIYAFGGVDPWVMYVASIWTHSQGAISAAVSLAKPDVYNATKQFLTCQVRQTPNQVANYRTGINEADGSNSRRNLSSFFQRLSISRVTRYEPESNESYVNSIENERLAAVQSEEAKSTLDASVELADDAPVATESINPESDLTTVHDSIDASNSTSELSCSQVVQSSATVESKFSVAVELATAAAADDNANHCDRSHSNSLADQNDTITGNTGERKQMTDEEIDDML